MADGTRAVCSACGYELGDPGEEVADPDDPDAPEDAHFRVQKRSDGEQRLQCTETGKLARPIPPDDPEHPSNKGQDGDPPPEPTGNENEQNQNAPQQQQPRRDKVYDLKEEKDQTDLLREVITNPSYGLNDDQITEIRAWSEDYGGQLPPDALEEIAGLMDGVQKQTAQLMRQRYELKINKWVRDQQSGDNGPHIGTGFAPQPQSVPNVPSPPSQGGRPSQEALEKARREGDMEGYNEGPSNSAIRESRKERESRREDRRERRREAMDKAADELAMGVAENIGDQVGSNYGRMQNIIFKVLERKADKDPDWFIEKEQKMQENLGISLFDLLEPSESKKQEDNNKNNQPRTDQEADEALDRVMNEQPTEPPAESNNTPEHEYESEDYAPMEASTDEQFDSDPELDDTEEEFEEIFG